MALFSSWKHNIVHAIVLVVIGYFFVSTFVSAQTLQDYQVAVEAYSVFDVAAITQIDRKFTSPSERWFFVDYCRSDATLKGAMALANMAVQEPDVMIKNQLFRNAAATMATVYFRWETSDLPRNKGFSDGLIAKLNEKMTIFRQQVLAGMINQTAYDQLNQWYLLAKVEMRGGAKGDSARSLYEPVFNPSARVRPSRVSGFSTEDLELVRGLFMLLDAYGEHPQRRSIRKGAPLIKPTFDRNSPAFEAQRENLLQAFFPLVLQNPQLLPEMWAFLDFLIENGRYTAELLSEAMGETSKLADPAARKYGRIFEICLAYLSKVAASATREQTDQPMHRRYGSFLEQIDSKDIKTESADPAVRRSASELRAFQLLRRQFIWRKVSDDSLARNLLMDLWGKLDHQKGDWQSEDLQDWGWRRGVAHRTAVTRELVDTASEAAIEAYRVTQAGRNYLQFNTDIPVEGGLFVGDAENGSFRVDRARAVEVLRVLTRASDSGYYVKY